jgi:pyrroline-5-carboxylate reductase
MVIKKIAVARHLFSGYTFSVKFFLNFLLFFALAGAAAAGFFILLTKVITQGPLPQGIARDEAEAIHQTQMKTNAELQEDQKQLQEKFKREQEKFKRDLERQRREMDDFRRRGY